MKFNIDLDDLKEIEQNYDKLAQFLTSNTNKNNNSNNDIGIIETHKIRPDYSYEVFYDKDTKVCYIAIADGVTPLYNADGSLKTYDEDKEQ